MLSFVQSYTVQMSQTIVANLRDGIERRLARWLLMLHDRIDGDDAGGDAWRTCRRRCTSAARASPTALHILEGERIVRCTRGQLVVRDRAALGAIAGDSYGGAEASYARMVGLLRQGLSFGGRPSTRSGLTNHDPASCHRTGAGGCSFYATCGSSRFCVTSPPLAPVSPARVLVGKGRIGAAEIGAKHRGDGPVLTGDLSTLRFDTEGLDEADRRGAYLDRLDGILETSFLTDSFSARMDAFQLGALSVLTLDACRAGRAAPPPASPTIATTRSACNISRRVRRRAKPQDARSSARQGRS